MGFGERNLFDLMELDSQRVFGLRPFIQGKALSNGTVAVKNRIYVNWTSHFTYLFLGLKVIIYVYYIIIYIIHILKKFTWF